MKHRKTTQSGMGLANTDKIVADVARTLARSYFVEKFITGVRLAINSR